MNKIAPSICCLLLSSVLAAATPKPPAAVPDFSGAYERVSARAVLVDSKGGTRPNYQIGAAEQAQLKPEYEKLRTERRKAQIDADEQGEPLVGRTAQCQGGGMPGMMGGSWPIEFIQSKDQLTVIQEIYTQVRRIYIGKPQKKLEDIEPGFYGRSVGRWEGQALLVDTIGIKAAFDQTMPHSDQIHIKEKIYFAPDGTLRDDITVEDPVVLVKPYSYTLVYNRVPDYEMIEYICEDNHYFIDENGKQALRPAGSAR